MFARLEKPHANIVLTLMSASNIPTKQCIRHQGCRIKTPKHRLGLGPGIGACWAKAATYLDWRALMRQPCIRHLFQLKYAFNIMASSWFSITKHPFFRRNPDILDSSLSFFKRKVYPYNALKAGQGQGHHYNIGHGHVLVQCFFVRYGDASYMQGFYSVTCWD